MKQIGERASEPAMSGATQGRAPRRGVYYGWVLVAALSVTEITSWGVLYYAFTVFINPMRDTLGWSSASISGAFSLALLLSGIIGLPLGRWLDHHGPRLVMSAGSFVAVALLIAWSRVADLMTFYLIWAGLGIAMGAVLYEPAFFVVTTWFRRKRGQALTLLTFFAGFASVIFVPLAGWLVQLQGWRDALVSLAVIVGVVTIPPHALMLRRGPEDMGLTPDGERQRALDTSDPEDTERSVTLRAAMRSSSFWLLIGAFFCGGVTVTAVFVYLVPYLTASGYPPGAAATIVGMVGIAALPGRAILTHLGNWFPRSLVATGIFLSQMIGLILLLVAPGAAGIAGFIILFGAGFGSVTPARAALVAEYYGPAHYGHINGTVAFILYLARALAPLGAGLIYEATGAYTAIFWGVVGILALAAALMAFSRVITADRGQ
jgi:MFS family permease